MMAGGGSGNLKDEVKMAIITSTINTHVYIEIPDNFLISTNENWLGDEKVIFQYDNASCHRAKLFLWKGI